MGHVVLFRPQTTGTTTGAPPIWRWQNHSGPPAVAAVDGPWSHGAQTSLPWLNQLYEDLVEVEALAITADEAVTQLPSRPPGKYGKTLARLYTLVGKTSGRAQGALERGEELMALRAAQLTAQVPKRSAARRAR